MTDPLTPRMDAEGNYIRYADRTYPPAKTVAIMPGSVRKHLYLTQFTRKGGKDENWEITGPQRRRWKHKRNRMEAVRARALREKLEEG